MLGDCVENLKATIRHFLPSPVTESAIQAQTLSGTSGSVAFPAHAAQCRERERQDPACAVVMSNRSFCHAGLSVTGREIRCDQDMKICIVSDSHDRAPMLASAVAAAKAEGAEAVIHCGDVIAAV